MTVLLVVSERGLTECMTRSFFTSLWLVLTHWQCYSEHGHQGELEIRSMSTSSGPASIIPFRDTITLDNHI
ncbi:uncharacterized protein BDW70DRAFT_130513 [Aspergillus foveolatus]|uniref:uncharacterized protein n=1 Tax=Aspergillus foveolatus TaxID=210207 RepID=UPI003CCCCF73